MNGSFSSLYMQMTHSNILSFLLSLKTLKFSLFGYLQVDLQAKQNNHFLNFLVPLFLKDNSKCLFLSMMQNKKLPKVNMHRLLRLREKGQSLRYMDTDLQ